MPKVVNGNRSYNVPENAVESYLKQGFDQVDENGEVVKRAIGGKKVTLAEYNKVLDELEELKAADQSREEIAKLQEEIKKLKAENAKLKKGE